MMIVAAFRRRNSGSKIVTAFRRRNSGDFDGSGGLQVNDIHYGLDVLGEARTLPPPFDKTLKNLAREPFTVSVSTISFCAHIEGTAY